MSKIIGSINENTPQALRGISTLSKLGLRAPLGIALIVVAAFIVYYPSLNGGFIMDDDLYVTNNSIIHASNGLYRIWCTAEPVDYYPITNTMFWIEWRLWGNNPTGYHVASLLLHVIESMLIWIILRKLSIPGAYLAAMIFTVHPVNVDAVAWIAQLKDMLALLFFLLSILCYLKMELPSSDLHNGSDRLALPPVSNLSSLVPSLFPWYWMSLAAFVSAMLSKGSVAVLPVLLLGIIWWLRPLTRRDLVRTAPFFLVAVALTAVHIWFQTFSTTEVHRNDGFVERLLGAGGVVWFYLYKALLPLNLAFIYPMWHIEAGNPLWWLPLLAALAVTAVLWRYRGSWGRPFLFAWGFFCVALVPVMGFTDVGFMIFSLVSDHYQHIAIIGVITLASAIWSAWYRRVHGKTRRVLTAIAVAAVCALSSLAWRQNEMYRDAFTLYQMTLEKNPDSWTIHTNIGIELTRAGLPREAMAHYLEALRLRPNDSKTRYNMSTAHYNMGNTLLDSGRLQEAIEHYQKALQFEPNYPAAHYNLGNVFFQTGHTKEAIMHYQEALRLKPDFSDAYYNLGNIYEAVGQYQQAIDCYTRALQLTPDNIEIYNNLGIALVQSGRPEEAIEHYRQALRLKSNFQSHYNLGLTLAKIGRLPEAIEHYKQALQLKPDYIMAYLKLMSAYSQTGQSSEAAATARSAIALARFQGQTALANQIEDWLKSYRANLSNLPNKSPSNKSSTPAP